MLVWLKRCEVGAKFRRLVASWNIALPMTVLHDLPFIEEDYRKRVREEWKKWKAEQ